MNFGTVNAAIITQLMIDRFPIEQLVSGVAGGVSPEAPLEAVTIPGRWGFHQAMYFHRDGASTPCTTVIGIHLSEQLHPGEEDACASGFVPARNLFSLFQFVFLRNAAVASTRYSQILPDGSIRTPALPGQSVDPAVNREMKLWFDVDPETFEAGQEVARQVSSGELELLDCRPEALLPNGSCGGEALNPAPQLVTGQNGVSGPTFVDNAEYRQWVYDKLTFDDGAADGSAPDRVLALDMETAAAARVA